MFQRWVKWAWVVSLGLLQACNSAFTSDTVVRSATDVALPIGSIHTPPHDTNSSVQFSFSTTGQIVRKRGVDLQYGSGTSSYAIRDEGRSELSMSTIQGAGSISVWALERYRAGFSFDASPKGGAFGFEAGARAGRIVSLEVFGGFGIVSSRSSVDWITTTTEPDSDDGEPRKTTRQTMNLVDDQPRLYGRAGIHLGARHSGPWLEGSALKQSLFQAPTSRDAIWIDVCVASAGWSIDTRYGTASAFVRGTELKDGWSPSIGLQFTGSVPMPD